jgi:23S rRNA (pseudouridine1915-N3)-methyltransferase
MRIRILAIGKLKEKYWKAAIAEYEKRLKPYIKLEILEGNEEEAPEKLSEKEKESLLAKEGRFFLNKIKEGDYNIALDLNGEMVSSEGLAGVIEKNAMMGGKTVNFLIGGSLGMNDAVKQHCQKRIAFGKATFPHQLIRVFLVEQIYRSIKIIRNEPYHK